MTGEDWGQGISCTKHFDAGFDNMINFDFQERVGRVSSPADLDKLFGEYAKVLAAPATHNVLSYLSSHDTKLFDRKKLVDGANALLLAPGGVQIYCGDETARADGPSPGGDRQRSTRSDMNWDSIEAALLAHGRKLGQFRARHVAIARGVHGKLSDAPYAFSRVAAKDRVVVALGATGTVSGGPEVLRQPQPSAQALGRARAQPVRQACRPAFGRHSEARRGFLGPASAPGAEHRGRQIGEMPQVAGGERGATRDGDAGDLGVAHVHRAPGLLARRTDQRRLRGSFGIERQHPVAQVFGQQLLETVFQAAAAFAFGQQRQTEPAFEDGDAGHPDRLGRLQIEPGHHRRFRLGTHQRRQHIGVEDDHFPNVSGRAS